MSSKKGRKRKLALTLILLLVVAFLVVLVNPLVKPIPFHLSIRVDPMRLERDVASLLNTDGYRDYTNQRALEQAGDYICEQWRAAHFEVFERAFEYGGNSYRNFSVFYGPEDAPRLVVGAHYDVCGSTPGADDNGSGVSAILELARLLERERPELSHRVELVAYTLEEPPFFRTPQMGSAVHATALKAAGVKVKAMISVEMIGYYSDLPGSQSFPIPGLGLLYPRSANFICVVGNIVGVRLTRSAKALMMGAVELDVRSFNAPFFIPGVDFSDHLNFWKRGFPALMVTDTAFFRNQNYHGPGDTIDTLDFDRMADVIRGLYALVIGL